MEKANQLRRRAEECRQTAAKAANAELREHYEGIARMWDKLAEERLTFFVQDTEDETGRRSTKDGRAMAARQENLKVG